MSDVSRVEELFLNAVGRTDPAERAAYLDAECGPDADLRRRVEVLLAAQPKVGRFLEPPADLNRTGDYQACTANPEPTVAVGDRVGPYKLLEKIGEGGMGEVWVADQLEPIKRRVALKLIKPGMDSRSVLGRFEAERQALAVMDHPNIARVLDAGTTTDGRPYFVMELVKGTPITEFCDARKLTSKQRLELFVPVCQAIQHAHMKGIIHRDIKPSNVMVELHDDRPVPKVIDFGVAKAIGQQLSEHTIYTGFGALVGTPAYMAPEQASFNALDIDTRADVYALGVLLYELLAGSPPIEAERMKRAALDEVLRIVRDEEPPRPSQRLSTSQAKASIAAVRGSEPDKLSALMKGEIDWIVMKALEKDRTRRYDSANGLAADVRRYLNGDAVEACPPTLGYRLKKAYRRNKAAVRVGGAFTLLMCAAVAVSSWLAVRATRAEAVARANEQEAQEQRQEAEENRNAWQEANGAYMQLAIDAEIRSNGARIDADLLVYKSNPRVGLLRLARPLKDSVGPLPLIVPGVRGTTTQTFPGEPELVKLREFQVAAAIAAGQEFVPLVPPLDFEGTARSTSFREIYERVIPNCPFYIGGDERYGLELRTLPDSTRIGTLREGTERVLQYGFSPDSKTIYTQDPDSIVRFWNTDGTLRAKTPLRPERFVYPAGFTADQVRELAERANAIQVADNVAVLRSEQLVGVKLGKKKDNWEYQPGPKGPTDLYSTRTGQFIRRLDKPGRRIEYWNPSPDERWLVFKDKSQDTNKDDWRDEAVIIISADDGRELARLEHPPQHPRFTGLWVEISPGGKWVLTIRFDHEKHEEKLSDNFRLWRTTDWKPVDQTTLGSAFNELKDRIAWHPSFVTDDVVDFGHPDVGGTPDRGLMRLDRPGSWVTWSSLGLHETGFAEPVGELGGTLIRCGRYLSNANTLKFIKPQKGRKYSDGLAKLAADGRFWENLDTVTEKEFPWTSEGSILTHPGNKHLPVGIRMPVPNLGLGSSWYHSDQRLTAFHFYPNAKRLDIPADLLQLWAQVVAGGELGPDGRFQPWDQPTWAAKQRELAAAKPPYPDFPFPGLAADPNVWHLVRAKLLGFGNNEQELAEWWRRTRQLRPDLGPDTWRTVEVAPLPREKK